MHFLPLYNSLVRCTHCVITTTAMYGGQCCAGVHCWHWRLSCLAAASLWHTTNSNCVENKHHCIRQHFALTPTNTLQSFLTFLRFLFFSEQVWSYLGSNDVCLGEGGTEGGKVGSFTEGTTCCNQYLTLNELFNS